MGVVETHTSRNAGFAATGAYSEPRLMPRLKTIIIGCVDPRGSVAHDVAALRDNPRVPGVRVSGLVHDVATGRTQTVVQPWAVSSPAVRGRKLFPSRAHRPG
ncbi:hypothetical protein [Streptomyces sp. NBC_01198]|uniref:hypothetical protein n=1 Tax=Streptomyces sp. NBC_01198 TaxID=2903769 RepID=UPI002E122F0E|nr:hypothetical protein OG702_04180 [Streptomyces sp. NBC_01198]